VERPRRRHRGRGHRARDRVLLGREWEWKLYSYDRPADLADRLRAAGFVAEDEETLLVASVADLPRDPAPPEGVELRAVQDATGVADLVAVHNEVFDETGNEAFGRQLLEEVAGGSVCAVVAYADGRPVSGGRIEFFAGTPFAALYGGSTLEHYRHRGIFRAVVAHRVAIAAERGYRYVQTDASADSCPIFLRMGFQGLGTTTPFMHPA
jgi:Acetyltransferase (GNAT) family